MNALRLFAIFLFFSVIAQASTNRSVLLSELDKHIALRDEYASKKQVHIASMKTAYSLTNANHHDAFEHYLILGREYQSFKFDSAFHYNKRSIESAYMSGAFEKIALAKIEFANLLISSGLLNESIDTLRSVNLSNLPNAIKARYYTVMSRGYFDLESFSQSTYYAAIYREKGMASYDSALNYLPEKSWEYQSLLGQKAMKTGNTTQAFEIFNRLINNETLANDEKAILEMNLAFVHELQGNKDEALKHMVNAAICDLQGAKKEAVAIFFVANYLYELDEVFDASQYISVALEDIRFYGSSFRLWQISQFLPVIKSEHILTIEDQKQKLFLFVIIVSILSITVLGAIFIIFKQLSVVRSAKNTIETANNKLEKSIEELSVANRIKEEYIGYYFSVNSQMVEYLEKLKNNMLKKLKKRQTDEVIAELELLNINKEKEKMFENFDRVFLKIFPDFVNEFNSLLKPEEQIILKEEQLLNTDLRIFALIRLGINDPEKIAKLLDYSLHTIYAYKTRIRNKSIYPNEMFEKKVMMIKHY
ncbi:MAG: hypothetical protein JXR22_11420 [Prolixibacteraceae bacterium]|nr:hypothetical protein [Prolixibacteraceae bacterium]